VSGATFGDLDADGDPDLVLAQDWGPLRIMMNEGQAYVDRTEDLGLGSFSGWVNGVALGDFNEDGQLDIVGTNWGWNLQHGRDQSARLYYGDVDANGILDLFESYRMPPREEYVPVRPLNDLALAVPALLRRFSSFADLASATLDEIVPPLRHVEATTSGSMVFLNRGSHLEGRPLPLAAQFTVAMGVSVVDANLDGHDDLVMSQNYFALPIATPRQDAGRGLLLLGDGTGAFSAVSLSGLAAYGEGRALATADFDGDGRSDVLVTQNSAPSLLYTNRSDQDGMSVRFIGPSENPWGIGTVLRVQYADGALGPARTISAGTGYWSQDSPVVILGPRDAVHAIRVRWPDGHEQVVPTDKEEHEIRVSYQN